MSTRRVGFAAGVATGSVLGIGASAVLALGLGVISVPAWASTTVQAQEKSTSKIVLENARVRVKDALFVPGDKPAMHTHELAHVGVVITGGTLIFNYPDGKSETLELPAGGAGFRDANVTHQAINPGKTPVRVIEVELK